MEFLYSIFDSFNSLFDFLINEDIFVILLSFTAPLGCIALLHKFLFKES